LIPAEGSIPSEAEVIVRRKGGNFLTPADDKYWYARPEAAIVVDDLKDEVAIVIVGTKELLLAPREAIFGSRGRYRGGRLVIPPPPARPAKRR
jgi:hypothetical protein